MANHPYARFRPEDLILRDELAIDRTILANERTLLAYGRSGLTLLIAGVTFMHFPQHPVLPVLGLVFMPVGLVVVCFGVYRYRQMRQAIGVLRDALRQADQAAASPSTEN
jgi:putative membrane protein